jgi:hypothetical protein
MKKLLLLFLFSAFLSCKNDKSSDIEENRTIPKIDGMKIDYENFEPSNTNLTSWLFVFSTSPDGKGNVDRVKLFTSEDEFTKDTFEKFSKIYQLNGADHVAKEMIYRLRKKMDFSKEDLVVVRMKKNKASDTLGYYQKDNTIYFCLDEGSSGDDKLEIIKFFKVQKGFQVDNCKPSLYDRKWQLKEIVEGESKNAFKNGDLVLTFNTKAKCEISTKCLTTKANFEQNDHELSLKYFQKGKNTCQDPNTDKFINYLKEVESISIENKQLILTLDAKSGQMIFE